MYSPRNLLHNPKASFLTQGNLVQLEGQEYIERERERGSNKIVIRLPRIEASCELQEASGQVLNWPLRGGGKSEPWWRVGLGKEERQRCFSE